jgi:hypothetical protein
MCTSYILGGVDEGDMQRKVGYDTREIAWRLYHDDRVLRGLWWEHSTSYWEKDSLWSYEPTSFQFAGGRRSTYALGLIFNNTIRAVPGRDPTHDTHPLS